MGKSLVGNESPSCLICVVHTFLVTHTLTHTPTCAHTYASHEQCMCHFQVNMCAPGDVPACDSSDGHQHVGALCARVWLYNIIYIVVVLSISPLCCSIGIPCESSFSSRGNQMKRKQNRAFFSILHRAGATTALGGVGGWGLQKTTNNKPQNKF